MMIYIISIIFGKRKLRKLKFNLLNQNELDELSFHSLGISSELINKKIFITLKIISSSYRHKM